MAANSKSKKKYYYAVKAGRKVGIFDTWDECKRQVIGFKGSAYKKFETLEEAINFAGIQTSPETTGYSGNPSSPETSGTSASTVSPKISKMSGIQKLTPTSGTTANSTLPKTPVNPENVLTPATSESIATQTDYDLIAYVDGSFNASEQIIGSGGIMFYKNEEITFSETSKDPDLISMRNVSGEILASEYVMKYALEHNLKTIKIVYDYAGIEKWCTGEWKTNKPGTIKYKEIYESISDKVHVTFEKVKGHSGDKYNDVADNLAKLASGVETV
ncbi:MAG: ribonuclease H family protein [Lachnospiraceae bacterium]|nr:ribonuclease H family protein [Lachnospiraceae bacterium]